METFGGLIVYAPDWISDSGIIEVFGDRFDTYCPKNLKGKHVWQHNDNYLGHNWLECISCRKKTECQCH